MNSPAGELCSECVQAEGCKIYYDSIPQRCLDYQCAYVQMKKVSVNFRPDKCHVIFERHGDVMHGLVDPDHPEAVEKLKGQIQAFLEEGLSVGIHVQGNDKPYIWAVEGKSSQYVYDTITNGSSNLYN